MNSPTSGEKRKFRRIHFSADSRLTIAGREWACHVVDISLKGALVDVPGLTGIATGQAAKLTMRLDSGETTISMDATIARVDGFRIGAHCVLIDSDSMMHLRRLVELNLGDEELLQRELAQLVE